jgi:predicted DNA-binding transcriptional regulator YafY
MRRANRLFQIVQLLRRSQATTAAQLAIELEVSERTIYRDVQDLCASGVPIQGEAGVGYALPSHFELPPLMFGAEEIQALVLGARMVQGWADAELARAARSALRKIEHALPESLRVQLDRSKLFVPDFHVERQQLGAMRAVRQGLDESRVLRLDYADEIGQRTTRAVRPLGLFYWGRSWTLTAWCELRADFRNFRLDRIAAVEVTAGEFTAEPGKRLEDFFARMQLLHEAAAAPARATKGTPASVAEPPRAGMAKAKPAATPTAARGNTGAPADPEERRAWREFQRLGSIGPACARDLVLLGFRRIEQLAGQDPNVLYARLRELTGSRQDPCVEDTLRCAIAQAEAPQLPAKWKQWFQWTKLRGQPAGTWPPELRRRRR